MLLRFFSRFPEINGWLSNDLTIFFLAQVGHIDIGKSTKAGENEYIANLFEPRRDERFAHDGLDLRLGQIPPIHLTDPDWIIDERIVVHPSVVAGDQYNPFKRLHELGCCVGIAPAGGFQIGFEVRQEHVIDLFQG